MIGDVFQGHIDFYPHDGSKQPDCQSRQSRAIFDVFKDIIGVVAQWIVGEPSRDLANNIGECRIRHN